MIATALSLFSGVAEKLVERLNGAFASGGTRMPGVMPSARFEYAEAKIRIVRISAIDVRGMIEDGPVRLFGRVRNRSRGRRTR